MATEKTDHPMRRIRIEKITLNIGAGKDEEELKRGLKLFKKITGIEPVKTITHKRIPAWELRPGLVIGCKLTLRGKQAHDLLRRFLEARDNKLHARQFDRNGNISFGIPEYIDVPGVGYDPDIKIMGFEVAVTLERPGFHIARRKVKQRKISADHRIHPTEAIRFMGNEFGTAIVEEEA